jgi:hypothetical protein
MSSHEDNAEKCKVDAQGPTNSENLAGDSDTARVDRLPTEKKPLPSPRAKDSTGRPPHAPYSRQQGYQGQHSGYSGATRPPQQLQSVVTSSFSLEDERDPSHRGTYPPVPRHVSVSINPADQPRWAAPAEDRYPPERLEVDVRDMEQDRRQEPPSDGQSISGKPSVVPPSPARGSHFPPLRRGSGSGSFMAPPEPPLKRSFWHHSRPNEEYTSSLPAEFIPPKRSKISPNHSRDPPSRSPSGMDMRDLRRPPSFFNHSLSWDSRADDMHYYHGMPPSRESPRYPSEHSRSFHHSMGGPPPLHHHHHHLHSSASPTSYRDDDMGSMSDHSRSRTLPPGRSHHHAYSHMPPQEVSYHHHSSPMHGASSGTPTSLHSSRRWSHHDSWQPPMPSPTSGPRRSPTNYHHGSPTMQFRDDIESSRSWSQSRERDPMPMSREEHRRLPHFDASLDHDSPYHSSHAYHNPSPYYGRSMPPLHHKPPSQHSSMHSSRGPMGLDAPEHRASAPSMDEGSHMGSEAGKSLEDTNDDKNDEKEGPVLLLALPQDRISLSETLCVVREVSLRLIKMFLACTFCHTF